MTTCRARRGRRRDHLHRSASRPWLAAPGNGVAAMTTTGSSATGRAAPGRTGRSRRSRTTAAIEVEAEIDSNKVGQTWSWKFKDNGNVFAKGQSTTTGPSGSFEVERKPANLAGTDHFVFRAVHPSSGEVCRATVAW